MRPRGTIEPGLRCGLLSGIAVAGILTLAACGGGGNNTPVPTPVPTAVIHKAVTPITQINVPVSHKTPVPSSVKPVHVALAPAYRGFLNNICRALANKQPQTLINALPYYQYNSGVYYGTFNAGEGQTGDPSLLNQWIPQGNPRCVEFEPGIDGHGAVVTRGWPVSGGWSLIEFDLYGGQWKINDFTFGDRGQVRYALESTSPEVVQYGPNGA